jgi:hypothetical protein
MGAPFWTDEESEKAVRLKADGLSHPEIGTRMGRTAKSIGQRLLYLRLTPEERTARHAARKQRVSHVSHNFVRGASRPTSEQIAERDARWSHPMTISQMCLGDPMPGQSALDQRGGVDGRSR